MSSTWVIIPPLVLGLGAIMVYGVARLLTRRNGVLAGLTTAVYSAGLIATLYLNRRVSHYGAQVWAASGSQELAYLAEPGALLIALVLLTLGTAVAAYSGRYLSLDQRYENYYPLLLLLSAAILSMLLAVDLFVLYLSTVMTSAASYVLVAFRRRTETAIEAGFKYAIMGSMASIVLLAGIGFLFRVTASLQLPLDGTQSWLGRLGIGLMMFAYLVKAAIVPGHTWLPDAHGRAPSSISAILSGIMIQAYLYVLIKTTLGVGVLGRPLGWLLMVLAVMNMVVGNAMALRQTYGKRLLAYSSIAQCGYMMLAIGLGLAYGRSEPIVAGFLLLVGHALMKSLAFLCKGVFHFYCGATLIENLNGLYHRVPVAGACFVVAIAGLSGVPPLVGFTAKLYVLLGATHVGGLAAGVAIALFLANSLLSLSYYLPLMGRVLRRTDHTGAPSVSLWMQVPIVSLGALVLLFGVLPGPVVDFAERAAAFLLSWGPS